MPAIRCLLQLPTIRCLQQLPTISAYYSAYYQMPTTVANYSCLLSDAYYSCLLSDAYYSCLLSDANYLTEVWLSCSDVIQGLLPKPYFPIWQCCGICVIRIWSLHTYRMLTKCKQDSYFTKWWQPKTRPHVTTDANYICLLSRCLLCLSTIRCQMPTIIYQLSDACTLSDTYN